MIPGWGKGEMAKKVELWDESVEEDLGVTAEIWNGEIWVKSKSVQRELGGIAIFHLYFEERK